MIRRFCGADGTSDEGGAPPPPIRFLATTCDPCQLNKTAHTTSNFKSTGVQVKASAEAMPNAGHDSCLATVNPHALRVFLEDFAPVWRRVGSEAAEYRELGRAKETSHGYHRQVAAPRTPSRSAVYHGDSPRRADGVEAAQEQVHATAGRRARAPGRRRSP